jgi:hypothetical protein
MQYKSRKLAIQKAANIYAQRSEQVQYLTMHFLKC